MAVVVSKYAKTKIYDEPLYPNPKSTQELNDENGIFYGINQISKNLILGNRKLPSSYNGLILGMPGSGKSFFAKNEIKTTD